MTEAPARPPAKVSARSWTLAEAADGATFVLGTALVLWLAGLLVTRELRLSWAGVVYLVLFWLLTAYVGLPRLQQVLARIYVPDYFIGRTLTSSGILGDPVNLAVDGTEEQLHAALHAGGWTRADEVTLRSSWGIIVSAVFRRAYPSAPVSPLFLFGRRQAFAYEQEVGGNASQRHHVRFWPTPADWVLPGGARVGWLAAGTFDRAVGLSLFTLQVTHKVDADIDFERDHVVASVRAQEPAATVRVFENFVAAFHARNGGGDVVRTDGNLVILDVTAIAVPAGTSAPPEPAPAATVQASMAAIGARRLPPPSLLVAGVLSVGKAVAGAAALSVAAVPSAVVVVLWMLTLARRAWARALLMGVAALDAIAQLAAVSAQDGRLSFRVLLDGGIAVLILVVVSSDESRRWVSR